MDKESGSTSITVSSNIVFDVELETKEQGWIDIVQTKSVIDSNVKLEYLSNPSISTRRVMLKVFPKSNDLKLDTVFIPILQEGVDIDQIIPEGDTKVSVVSAEMIRGNVYGQQTVDKTIDGNYATNYSGLKVNKPDSVIIDYTLESTIDRVDYIKLTQRLNQDQNSIFSNGSIWIKTKGNSEWTLSSSFEVNPGENVIANIKTLNPEKIRVCLQRSLIGGNVSLAEFECFKTNEVKHHIEAASIYFTDGTYSELKSGLSYSDIQKIKSPIISSLAADLWNQKYEKQFRSRSYLATLDPREEGKKLTIGSRSQCDNAMGIYFEANKPVVVFFESTQVDRTTLYIRKFDENGGAEKITLEKGLNIITPTVSGNGYIQYWSEADESLSPIKIHVVYGNELGFWDVRQNDTNESWRALLQRALKLQENKNIPSLMLDILGERVQLCNTVDAFNQYAPEKITNVLEMHDQLVDLEYTLMGLKKYDAVPTSRLLGVRSWGGSPNWNGFSANYPNAESTMLIKEDFLSNIWLYAHEFGHANQVAQMKGAGWAEVTNNVFSVYVQYCMGDRNNLRLEHVAYKYPGTSEKIIGDRFNYYLDEAFVNKTLYLQQGNQSDIEGVFNADPFVSLVPLWQLTLFFVLNEHSDWYKPDLWADIYREAIHDNNSSYSYGQRYTNFMKRAINASGYNLAPFFNNMGLLKVGDRMIGDYGAPKHVKITQAMVDEVTQLGETKISLSDVALGYISANSLAIFKNKMGVEGTLNGGIINANGAKYISSIIWKNAVAYEVYENNKLLHVSILGTGITDNTQTYVRFPENATHIQAVSWDNKRVNVYEKK